MRGKVIIKGDTMGNGSGNGSDGTTTAKAGRGNTQRKCSGEGKLLSSPSCITRPTRSQSETHAPIAAVVYWFAGTHGTDSEPKTPSCSYNVVERLVALKICLSSVLTCSIVHAAM